MKEKLTYKAFIFIASAVLSVMALLGIWALSSLFMVQPARQSKTAMLQDMAGPSAAFIELYTQQKPLEQMGEEELAGMARRAAGQGRTLVILAGESVLWPQDISPSFRKKGEVWLMEANGKRFLGSFAEIPGGRVFVGYPESAFSLNPIKTALGITGMFLVMILALVLLGFFATRRFTATIGQTTGAMWALAEGDLSFKMENRGFADERAFRRHFNRAMDKLRDFMGRVRELVSGIQTMVSQASTAAEQTGRSIQEQQDRIEAGSAALEEVSASVNEVSASVQAATDLSSEARNMASGGEESVEAIADKATQARQSMDKLVEEVGRLERVAEEITGALTLVNDISEETNLLSLNAAIEASKAGEAGRGFAVVADEIRNLAERSLKASKEVKEVVEGIMASLKGVVSGIRESSDMVQDLTGDIQGLTMTFRLIANSVEQVAEKMLTVSTATEEQSQVISELSEQMSQITSSGEEVAAAAQELSRTSVEIKSRTDDLTSLLGEFLLLKKETGEEPL